MKAGGKQSEKGQEEMKGVAETKKDIGEEDLLDSDWLGVSI